MLQLLEVQSLDVISVNIWQIIVSLCNLVILFLILKRFLFKPVKKALKERQREVEEQYARAEKAENDAKENKEAWNRKMDSADKEAEIIIKNAVTEANRRSEELLAETKEKSDAMYRQTQESIELEHRKARETIKSEIVDISACLTEKILDREIKTDDHRKLIDTFIDEIGEKDE